MFTRKKQLISQQSPVNYLIHKYHSVQILNSMHLIGFDFSKFSRKQLKHVMIHLKEILGQLPKCKLDELCVVMSRTNK